MQNINKLFNRIFKTSEENYVDGNNAISNCRKKFSAQKDDISVKVFLYFFPIDSKIEKNKDEFWFLKYKDDKEYDEYDFAEDLLKNYAEYLSDKNKINFENRLKLILLKFENYKLFTIYIFNMLEYGDYLMSTVAYFTKDSSFYQEALKIFILPENIQTEGFIQSIKDLIAKKIKYLEKTEGLQKQIELLKEKSEIKQNKEEDLQKQINELSKQMLYNDKNIAAQLKALKEEKLQTDSQIKALKEEKIYTDSQIKALKEEKLQTDSQIKALKEEKIYTDSQINALKEEILHTDSQLKALKEEKLQTDSQINALKEEILHIAAQLKALKEEKLQTDSQINTLKEEILHTDCKLEILMTNKNNQDNQIKKLSFQIEELKKENKDLKNDMVELQTRMDKIDLRDTIKLCIKYLYKVLKSHFNEMREVYYFWDEIKEIKRILKRNEFKKFYYINDFIEDLDFTSLNPLNTATHN